MEPRQRAASSHRSIRARSTACTAGSASPSARRTALTGRETSSPRGRVYLMRGVAEGRHRARRRRGRGGVLLPRLPRLRDGLSVGRALRRAARRDARRGRAAGAAHAASRSASRAFALRERAAAPAAPRARARRARPRAAAAASDRLALRSCRASRRRVAARCPPSRRARERRRLPRTIPAEGVRRGRVALFEGCLMPELFGAVNAATARVLARERLRGGRAGGPGLLRRAPPARGRSRLRARARARERRRLRGRRRDRGELRRLRRGAARRRARPARARHLRVPRRGRARGGAGAAPGHALLRRPLPPRARASACRPRRAGCSRACPASASCRTTTRRAAAAPRASTTSRTRRRRRRCSRRKLDALAQADPDWIATGNPGCLMQLAAGARARGLRARVVHPVELL